MKIKQVQFHSAITIPGTEILSTPSISKIKFPKTTTTLIKDGVFIETGEGSKASALVPLTNCQTIIFEGDLTDEQRLALIAG